jgi:hypothetical protein
MQFSLRPEIDRAMQAEAERRHISYDVFLQEIIENYWHSHFDTVNNTSNSTLKNREEVLVSKINKGFPPSFWEQYGILIQKRDNNNLSDGEYAELLSFSDAIEAKDAERAEYLVELAQIHNIPVKSFIQSLGLKSEKPV